MQHIRLLIDYQLHVKLFLTFSIRIVNFLKFTTVVNQPLSTFNWCQTNCLTFPKSNSLFSNSNWRSFPAVLSIRSSLSQPVSLSSLKQLWIVLRRAEILCSIAPIAVKHYQRYLHRSFLKFTTIFFAGDCLCGVNLNTMWSHMNCSFYFSGFYW